MLVWLCDGEPGLLGSPPGRTAEFIPKKNPPAPPPPKIVQPSPVLVAPVIEPAMFRLRETSIVDEVEVPVGVKMTLVVNEVNELWKAPWIVGPPVVVIEVPRWPWLELAMPW